MIMAREKSCHGFIYVLFSPTECNANRAVLHSADGRNGVSLDRIEAELTSSVVSSHGNWLHRKTVTIPRCVALLIKKCFTRVSSYFLAIFEFQERRVLYKGIKQLDVQLLNFDRPSIARNCISWHSGERCTTNLQENSISSYISSWLRALQFLMTVKTF